MTSFLPGLGASQGAVIASTFLKKISSKGFFNDEDTLNEVKYLAHVYRQIGYECIGVSAMSGKNVDKVKALMHNKVSMFSGHSGVGKSTLVNAIEPSLDINWMLDLYPGQVNIVHFYDGIDEVSEFYSLAKTRIQFIFSE